MATCNVGADYIKKETEMWWQQKLPKPSKKNESDRGILNQNSSQIISSPVKATRIQRNWQKDKRVRMELKPKLC